ncbi:MAG: MATE family efflux transporter [Clostridia bacterium]|nr:MATE family efflux transporter [Clostridia bacterium]MBR0407403.1 MATE family efflux transporter [Clostridia bacterium]
MGSLLARARRTLIGDRAFYRAVLAIIIPVIIQSSISNFVNFLDNLMVGALGDAQMSGVSIANQLVFVFNLAIFGGLAGPGIFGAQFYGAGDIEGMRNTFRIKLLESLFLLAVAFTAFIGFNRELISLFLQGDGDARMAEAMLKNGQDYLMVILVGLPAFALTQCYAGTLREMGETRLPMAASVAAVFTNAVFNYLLIFGKLGLPRLEVVGAAVATVISRYVELGIVMAFTHRHHRRFTFIEGAFRTLKVPGALFKKVLRMGAPLLMNELLWSIGMSTLTAVYSMCGLVVVSALSISSTISNLFNSVYMSMGTAVAVMVGQALGAGDFEKAKSDVWKLIAFGIAGAAAMGILLALFAPLIPRAYTGVTQDVRDMATRLLRVTSCAMPLYAFAHCTYFTLRSGGKTIITFLFDSGYTWAISVPLALLMVKVVRADIIAAYATVEGANVIKCVIGYLFVKSGKWIQNLTHVAD